MKPSSINRCQGGQEKPGHTLTSRSRKNHVPILLPDNGAAPVAGRGRIDAGARRSAPGSACESAGTAGGRPPTSCPFDRTGTPARVRRCTKVPSGSVRGPDSRHMGRRWSPTSNPVPTTHQLSAPTRPSETRIFPGSGLLTVNSSTENCAADWPEISQKSGNPATSRRQAPRGNRASRAAQGASEKAEKDSVVRG